MVTWLCALSSHPQEWYVVQYKHIPPMMVSLLVLLVVDAYIIFCTTHCSILDDVFLFSIITKHSIMLSFLSESYVVLCLSITSEYSYVIPIIRNS